MELDAKIRKPQMKEYQIRVVDEKIALDTKIEKLSSFILSNREGIAQKEWDLMKKQLSSMKEYSDCLGSRMKND